MKTNFIYAGTIGTLVVLAIIILIVIIKSRKNANQNKMDGKLLDGCNLPEGDLYFLEGECPFVGRFEGYN